MFFENHVEKPKQRSKVRSLLGKEYFIIKRKAVDLFSSVKFAQNDATTQYSHNLIRHKSILLRPLKNVEMVLQHNKVINLGIALKHINNVIIKPGETFSIWKSIGRPTLFKGYKEGLALRNGQIGTAIGGGLCQLGNLIYWMALHSPLLVEERWRHGYDVFPDLNRTIPFGCGSTLAYNYIDLRLKNNSPNSFQIALWLDDEFLNGEINCKNSVNLKYRVYKTDHLIKQQWWSGYTRHNKIWRTILDLHNQTETNELIAENNAILMYRPFLEEAINQ